MAGLLLCACASNPNFNSTDLATSKKLSLNLCRTKVSNPPTAIAGRVLRESALSCLNNRSLLVAPAPNSCITSGYGRRFGKRHHGVDFQSNPAGWVLAAGAGTIVQKYYRAKDLGNWIVIDHGAGVYTAYGHLAHTEREIFVGAMVKQGQRLGIMGSTGKAATGVHLHYEVRAGRLTTASSFFSLKSVDPFKLPANCG